MAIPALVLSHAQIPPDIGRNDCFYLYRRHTFFGCSGTDLASARAGAVWDEQDTSQTTENTLEEIEPKPLSLKDLENLTQDDGPKRHHCP